MSISKFIIALIYMYYTLYTYIYLWRMSFRETVIMTEAIKCPDVV